MKKINISKKQILFSILFFSIFPFIASASLTDGTIDLSQDHYAWSERLGWINFSPISGAVHVSDTNLIGYAWGEYFGWINLNPMNAGQGVHNDGEGNLSGYAWGTDVGWIDFDQVMINNYGKFTGYAYNTITGKISFDCLYCNVYTDWRPATIRDMSIPFIGGGGGGGSSFITAPAPDLLEVSSTDLMVPSSSVVVNLDIPVTNSSAFVSTTLDVSTSTKQVVKILPQNIPKKISKILAPTSSIKTPSFVPKSTVLISTTFVSSDTISQSSDYVSYIAKKESFFQSVWRRVANFFVNIFSWLHLK